MGRIPHDAEPPPATVEAEPASSKQSFRAGMWQKLHHLFIAKDDPTHSPIDALDWPPAWVDAHPPKGPDPLTRTPAIGLPRQTTFKRQNSERREHLLPVEPCNAERRELSSTRRVSTVVAKPRATSTPPSWEPNPPSAPPMTIPIAATAHPGPPALRPDAASPSLSTSAPATLPELWSPADFRPPRPPSTTSSDDSHYPRTLSLVDQIDLHAELDHRWILNLSMHFRDKSDREKFFVTYAETPSRWRRVTISCDYRGAEPSSLETDLKELQFQRDKSVQIYEAIRDSLPDIQFYDTVTNLKLETTDGRLHVHVTEDVNEKIPYPPRHTVAHLLDDPDFHAMEVAESELSFDSHLSGFVYKVRYRGKVYIKKEIPGPDTVDEFLYEINALHALHGASHIITLEGIVLDDACQLVKGLLIGYAEKGAIVDLLYDHHGSIPWEDRCRWAEHAVRGLHEIHAAGYVQGDLTLSNVVVDADGDAKIIDINRRGCPVGWEPPEIATKIASQQRISMYIGAKSDLYQLGMTMWALAMGDDEPERHVPPLSVDEFPAEVPEWYQDVVRICLSTRPQDRLSAKELIDLFPGGGSDPARSSPDYARPALRVRTVREYIDPAHAVERDDIERLAAKHPGRKEMIYSPESSRDDYTFTYPKSSNYEVGSESSRYERPRGRTPVAEFGHLTRIERGRWGPDDEISPAQNELEPQVMVISPDTAREFDEVRVDGHPYLVPRATFSADELAILERPVAPLSDSHVGTRAVEGSPERTDRPGLARPLLARRSSVPTGSLTPSESTPRNSHTLLPALARRATATLADPATDESSRDVKDNHSECGHSVTGQTDSTYASDELIAFGPSTVDGADHASPHPKSNRAEPPGLPASLPYADSGYDEPLGLVDDGDATGPDAA